VAPSLRCRPGSGAVSAFTSNLLKDIADEPVQLSQPPVASSAAFAVCLPGSGPPPAQPSSAGSGSPEGGKTALPGSSGIMLAVDINTDACEATAFTCRSNGASVEVVRSDKWGCMRKRLSAQVDVLIFNPPYVPTPDDEVGGVGIEAAWAGGLRGRRVLDQVMPQVGHLLSPNGVFYLIAVTENHPGEIADIMGEYGFACLVVAKRRAFNEALIVLKFRRKHAPGGESWQHADFEEGLSPP